MTEIGHYMEKCSRLAAERDRYREALGEMVARFDRIGERAVDWQTLAKLMELEARAAISEKAS